jgi:hypothetical protein
MEPFTKALKTIAGVMRDGAATHPDKEWVRRSVEYHVARAEAHLQMLRDGEQLEDHLAHAATRLLMALALRELGLRGRAPTSPGMAAVGR